MYNILCIGTNIRSKYYDCLPIIYANIIPLHQHHIFNILEIFKYDFQINNIKNILPGLKIITEYIVHFEKNEGKQLLAKIVIYLLYVHFHTNLS